jgi:hypothetical protein
MLRFTKTDQAVFDAHASTQEAMRELECTINDAFEQLDVLVERLQVFDRRLQNLRGKLCRPEAPAGARNGSARPESYAPGDRRRAQEKTRASLYPGGGTAAPASA